MSNVSNQLMQPQLIRVENLKRLIKQKYNGVLKDFVEDTWPDIGEEKQKTKQNYISQVWTHKKTFSEKLAREIEIVHGFSEGFLSRPQVSLEETVGRVSDYDLLEGAIVQILNQLIQSKIIIPKGSTDLSLFAALIISRYKELVDLKGDKEKSEKVS